MDLRVVADAEALPGTIAEAQQRYQAACQAEHAAQRAYERLRGDLRALQQSAPPHEPPSSDPDAIAAWQQQVAQHRERLAALQTAADRQGAVVQQCTLESEHWRQEISRRHVGLANARRRLGEAMARAQRMHDEADRKERDAALLLAAAHHEHQQAAALIQAAEAELRRYGG